MGINTTAPEVGACCEEHTTNLAVSLTAEDAVQRFFRFRDRTTPLSVSGLVQWAARIAEFIEAPCRPESEHGRCATHGGWYHPFTEQHPEWYRAGGWPEDVPFGPCTGPDDFFARMLPREA